MRTILTNLKADYFLIFFKELRMKTKKLMFVFFSLILISCQWNNDIYQNPTSQSDLSELNIFGNVSKVELYSYKAIKRGNTIEKGEKKRKLFYDNDAVFLFNNLGMFTQRDFLDREGDVKYRWRYEYNGKNQLVIMEGNEMTKLSILDETSGKSSQIKKGYNSVTWSFEYDENGNIISQEKSIQNELWGIWQSKFDIKGNRTEEVNLSLKGEILSKTIFSYDDNGNLIKTVTYNKDGSKEEHKEYLFDAKGNKIQGMMFSRNGTLTQTINYKYDRFDNIIEEREIDLRNNDQTMILTTFRYKYDDKNNWIEKISFDGNNPQFLEERLITYYD